MLDAGSTFISEKFKEVCKWLNIEQAVSLSCQHQSNGHVEACIRLIKEILKMCIYTNAKLHIALLQIRATPLGQGLPSPATLYLTPP